MLLGVVCVEESDGSTIIFVPLGVRIWAVQGRKRCNCMCSGSARMWEQLCSPGESNSDHKVPRSPSDALSNSPIRPPLSRGMLPMHCLVGMHLLRFIPRLKHT